jgi:hypothetical protein
MTLRSRRFLSWLGALSVGAAVIVGAAHLPGARGAEGELHWRLERLATASPRFERDMGLLVAAFSDAQPAACAAEVQRWLAASPVGLRPRLLHLLWAPVRMAAPDAALREVVLDWVMSLPLAERAALLPVVGELWLSAATISPAGEALRFQEGQVDFGRLIEFLQPGGSTSSRAAATAVELQFAL